MSTFVSLPWIIWVILLPLIGALLCFLQPRRANLFGIASAVATTLATLALALQLLEQGVLRYALGGWGAPLGIDLYADGLSMLMLLTSATVGAGCS